MNDQQRRRIAYIVGRLNSNKPVNHVFDYQLGQYFSMSGQVDLSHINIFDYSTSSYLSGNASGAGRFSLFDYESSSYVDLKFSPGNFSGFDYVNGTHFSGTSTTSGQVSLYDYSTGTYYNFSV